MKCYWKGKNPSLESCKSNYCTKMKELVLKYNGKWFVSMSFKNSYIKWAENLSPMEFYRRLKKAKIILWFNGSSVRQNIENSVYEGKRSTEINHCKNSHGKTSDLDGLEISAISLNKTICISYFHEVCCLLWSLLAQRKNIVLSPFGRSRYKMQAKLHIVNLRRRLCNFVFLLNVI